MSLIHFTAIFDLDAYKKYGIGKNENVFLVRYDTESSAHVRAQLNKLSEEYARFKKGECKPPKLVIDVDRYYKKRSEKMNKYLWKSYELEAYCKNGGKLGETGVTKESLYMDDIRRYAQTKVIRVAVQNVLTESRIQYKTYGHLINVLPVSATEVDLVVYHTTSFFDTDEMSKWLDMRLDRLASLDILDEIAGSVQENRGDLQNAKRVMVESKNVEKEIPRQTMQD
ncbi:MAG: hypothetical protein PHX80_04090 [Candidatus Nanoarchaeia archaeon]|nr:hypothetical protein [Candidatus Nanoarchaeia archaeon]